MQFVTRVIQNFAILKKYLTSPTPPVPTWENSMVAYRAYFIGNDGHFKKVRVLECPDDKAVIAEAKKLQDGYDVEIWDLARMVIRLETPKK